MPRSQHLASTETPIEIRFADVDMMQVVHHAVYLHWFEKMRFRALESVFGLSFRELSEHGIALPLTRCSLEYLRPFRFGDEPVGYVEIELFKKAMFGVHYFIYDRVSERLHTRGSTHHVYLDRQGRLMLRPPEFVRAAFERVRETYAAWVRIGEG